MNPKTNLGLLHVPNVYTNTNEKNNQQWRKKKKYTFIVTLNFQSDEINYQIIVAIFQYVAPAWTLAMGSNHGPMVSSALCIAASPYHLAQEKKSCRI